MSVLAFNIDTKTPISISGSGGSMVNNSQPPPPPTDFVGAVLTQPVNAIGSTTISAMLSGVDSTNIEWYATAVGILPGVITCPVTNCRFPVPDCHFEHPCKLVSCCKKKK